MQSTHDFRFFATATAAAAALALSISSRGGPLDGFSASARSFKQADGQTDVMADDAEYSFGGDSAGWTTFSGNVAIRYKGFELRADRIRYNSETGDAEASGNVSLVGQDGTLWKGEELAINLRERAGAARAVDLYTRPFRVLADGGAFDAAGAPGQIYEIENATLTTCTNEPGSFHWCVRARTARFRPGDDVTATGVVPRLFGIPFFYIPWYWKDLERHYGFRFQPGYKHSWGAYLLGTYKLPILRDKKNKEFIDSYTFADFRSDRGWAVGEKAAWEFGENDSKGYLTGWYMPSDDDPPDEIGPDADERYRVRLQHSWNATDRDQVLVQGLYVSDTRVQKDFFREEWREMTEPENYATWTHYGDDYTAGLSARPRLNDIYSQVERLPEAWFSLNSLELGETGVYFENDDSLAFLRRVFEKGSSREDYDSFRGDAEFRLSYPRKYFGCLSVVPRAGYRATYYDKTLESYKSRSVVSSATTNDVGQVSWETSEVEEVVSREGGSELRSIFEVGAEISTRAYGYWDAADGTEWRHVAEPYVDWTLRPRPDLRPFEILQFDSVDALDKENTARLGWRQRWQYRRPDGSPREFAYLDLWTDINLDAEDDEEAVSDFGWDARQYPSDWMRLQTKGVYDNDAGELDRADVVLVSWHDVFRCDVEYLWRNDRNSLFSGSVTWYPNERWAFNLFGRYEFETSQVEEVGGWIQRSWDCIALRLVASVEPGYDKDDGSKEEDDWRITLAGWLTDFVPARILEEDNR
ncbi:MAG: LPS-assembly protein LptD [Kiritimatiellae bacterium]|nr:LPS-assembly protein LptD [Kiritimatiellia bacterium]